MAENSGHFVKIQVISVYSTFTVLCFNSYSDYAVV